MSVKFIIVLFNFRDAATGKSKNWTALAVKRGGDVRMIQYILNLDISI